MIYTGFHGIGALQEKYMNESSTPEHSRLSLRQPYEDTCLQLLHPWSMDRDTIRPASFYVQLVAAHLIMKNVHGGVSKSSSVSDA